MEKQIRLYNPSIEDFKYTYFDDDNIAHEFTINAMDFASFSEPIANFMEKHLIDFLIVNSNGDKINWEREIEKWRQKVRI